MADITLCAYTPFAKSKAQSQAVTLGGHKGMFKKIAAGIAVVSTVFLASVVLGEDAVKADPKHYTVEFENDKVRVIRIRYGPGEESVMHTHGRNVSVFLTNSTVRMTFPDGTSEDVSLEAGTFSYAESEEHQPVNLSDESLEVLVVELKE